MLKLVDWDLRDHVEILTGASATFSKQAAAFEGEYSSEILDAISNISAKPGCTYLLVNAMGAGEYYGSNKNNDYFPEKALRDYHKTFEALAYVYKHHVNKDPQRSYGKVIFSFYNEKMHRVELIIEVVNEKSQDVLEKITKGQNVALSMGCKVPYDVCSECGNKAKTRAEYCEHLRRGSAGVVNPNGRKPYAINLQPKFFDISFVTIPADPTASVMAKVASKIISEDSTFVNSELNMDSLLKKSGIKHADIIKRVEGKVEAIAADPKGLIPYTQENIPLEDIKTVTSKYKLNDILSTLLAMRIMPKRQDFQRLVLYSVGNGQLSDTLDRMGYEFPVSTDVNPIIPMDINPLRMNSELAQNYKHWMPGCSCTKPLVIIRVIEKAAALTVPEERYEDGFGRNDADNTPRDEAYSQKNTKVNLVLQKLKEKQAKFNAKYNAIPVNESIEDKTAEVLQPSGDPEVATPKEHLGSTVRNPFFAITGLGALYLGYKRLMDMGASETLPQLERTMISNPWMLPILAGGIGLAAAGAQRMLIKESAYYVPQRIKDPGMLKSIAIAAVPSYFYSGLQESKAQKGEQLDEFQNFVRKHPFITSVAGLGILRSGLKRFNKTASAEDIVSRMDYDTLDKLYQEIIS